MLFDQLHLTAVTDVCRPYCSMSPLRSAYGMLARRASLGPEIIGALRSVPAKTMENVRRITTTPSRPTPTSRNRGAS